MAVEAVSDLSFGDCLFSEALVDCSLGVERLNVSDFGYSVQYLNRKTSRNCMPVVYLHVGLKSCRPDWILFGSLVEVVRSLNAYDYMFRIHRKSRPHHSQFRKLLTVTLSMKVRKIERLISVVNFTGDYCSDVPDVFIPRGQMPIS